MCNIFTLTSAAMLMQLTTGCLLNTVDNLYVQVIKFCCLQCPPLLCCTVERLCRWYASPRQALHAAKYEITQLDEEAACQSFQEDWCREKLTHGMLLIT